MIGTWDQLRTSRMKSMPSPSGSPKSINDEIRLAGSRIRQSLAQRLRFDDAPPLRLQSRAHEAADLPLVFHQNGNRQRLSHCYLRHTIAQLQLCNRRTAQRQRERKGHAPAGAIGADDLPMMRLDNGAAYGQPQPHARSRRTHDRRV